MMLNQKRGGSVEILGDPYSKGILLPRIPIYRVQGNNSQVANLSRTTRNLRPISITQAQITSRTARTFARMCLLGPTLLS